MPFYAVARGRTVGTFLTWNECQEQVNKFPNARFKKFDDKESAEAFIKEHREIYPNVLRKTPKPSAACCSTDLSDSTLQKRSSPPSIMMSKAQAAGQHLSVSESSSGTVLQKTKFKPANKAQLIPPRPMCIATGTTKSVTATAVVNPKRKLRVSEDRVVPMNKRQKLEDDAVKFNENVDLNNFAVDEEGYVIVYTDGACKGNGKQKARAGIGVWFGDYHSMNISLPVEGDRRTNNTAEIQAAEKAILKAKEAGINKLNIRTDSQFLINCMTIWINKWRANNWRLTDGKDVKNREDLEKIDAATKDVRIKWSYVKGHAGHHGNEQADNLAVAGSLRSIPVK